MIVRAKDARLFDGQGREYLDLCAGYGSIWLGHAHAGVNRALAAQLDTYAAPGYLPFDRLEAAHDALGPYLPASHRVGGLYSTGMEAVEVALRAAWAQTGRTDVAGFAGSTHGRSFLTAALGAAEPQPGRAFVHTLPGFAAGPAAGCHLEKLAREVPLAAIVVEPVQMSGGGHEIGADTCSAVFSVAREHGAVVIFDETLTGLHRCGALSYAEAAQVVPDILVLGKGLANGYPAAAVSVREGLAWDRERVRPGSTFWNHPLACAAIAATLGELTRLDTAARVASIERVIRAELGRLELRGRGAMWCLGSPQAGRQIVFANTLMDAGVVVSYYDRYIRLLPPLCISEDDLARACRLIATIHAATFG
jgi:acetylornithine/succinyldiaminopimelate/putrescine aminotransferase